MNTRIALIDIIVESNESVGELNRLLSEHSQYIIGRMGIPYREKNISIISIPENSECFPALIQKQLMQKHQFKRNL